jgi:hypothetical protein
MNLARPMLKPVNGSFFSLKFWMKRSAVIKACSCETWVRMTQNSSPP